MITRSAPACSVFELKDNVAMLDANLPLYHIFFCSVWKRKKGLPFSCVQPDEYNIVAHQGQENGCKRMWLTFAVKIEVLGSSRALENKGLILLFHDKHNGVNLTWHLTHNLRSFLIHDTLFPLKNLWFCLCTFFAQGAQTERMIWGSCPSVPYVFRMFHSRKYSTKLCTCGLH